MNWMSYGNALVCCLSRERSAERGQTNRGRELMRPIVRAARPGVNEIFCHTDDEGLRPRHARSAVNVPLEQGADAALIFH